MNIEFIKNKKVVITITSCKRIKQFEQTLTSLHENFIDLDLIDLIIHYDDSSSDNDRIIMQSLMQKLFPDKLICRRYFDDSSFSSKKRHMEIMKIWKSDLELLDIDYVFHTEDDWLYTTKFSISEAIKIMEDNSSISQVNYSQNLRKFPDNLVPKIIGDFWEWVYLENLDLQQNIFLDEVEMQLSNIPGYWCYFINWPHFSFRPGLTDIKKISKIQTFNNIGESFELEFATRYSKLYKTFCYKKRVCEHIGDKSSYELNNSKR
jgi:hypothetical protein